MLNALKFVRGAVSKKDYQPALKHFRIKDGRVMGYNGIIALSSPIPIDINATPKADAFVKAIERCKETTAIHVTPSGKLGLRSGGFKAFIECTDEYEVLDAIQPEGIPVDIAHDILPAFHALEPFIGTDASRPWATGILLRQYSAFATNNIIVAEYWLGYGMPDINLPSAAIDELVRIGEEPSAVWLSDRSMTFFFEGDRWMRTQLLGLDWPNVDPILSIDPETLQDFPPGFFDAIETLAPFVEEEGRIYFRDGEMTTSPHEGVGASIDIAGLPTFGAFNYKHLRSLQGIATAIDFSKKPPAPCPFRGEKLRGVILGMVDE